MGRPVSRIGAALLLPSATMGLTSTAGSAMARPYMPAGSNIASLLAHDRASRPKPPITLPRITAMSDEPASPTPPSPQASTPKDDPIGDLIAHLRKLSRRR